MNDQASSPWLGTVTSDSSPRSHLAFNQIAGVLADVQPVAIDRGDSWAEFGGDVIVDLFIQHATEPSLTIGLVYTAGGGYLEHPLGFEEYDQPQSDSPIERRVLDNLAAVLRAAYQIEDTSWKGHLALTVTRAQCPVRRPRPASN